MTNQQFTYQLNHIYKDENNQHYEYIREFSTCCAGPFYHMKDVASSNVFVYDSYGRRLNHMLSPVNGFDIIGEVQND